MPLPGEGGKGKSTFPSAPGCGRILNAIGSSHAGVIVVMVGTGSGGGFHTGNSSDCIRKQATFQETPAISCCYHPDPSPVVCALEDSFGKRCFAIYREAEAPGLSETLCYQGATALYDPQSERIWMTYRGTRSRSAVNLAITFQHDDSSIASTITEPTLPGRPSKHLHACLKTKGAQKTFDSLRCFERKHPRIIPFQVSLTAGRIRADVTWGRSLSSLKNRTCSVSTRAGSRLHRPWLSTPRHASGNAAPFPFALNYEQNRLLF